MKTQSTQEELYCNICHKDLGNNSQTEIFYQDDYLYCRECLEYHNKVNSVKKDLSEGDGEVMKTIDKLTLSEIMRYVLSIYSLEEVAKDMVKIVSERYAKQGSKK